MSERKEQSAFDKWWFGWNEPDDQPMSERAKLTRRLCRDAWLAALGHAEAIVRQASCADIAEFSQSDSPHNYAPPKEERAP